MDLSRLLHDTNQEDRNSVASLFVLDPDLTAGDFQEDSQKIEILPESELPVYLEKYNTPVRRKRSRLRARAPIIPDSPPGRGSEIEVESASESEYAFKAEKSDAESESETEKEKENENENEAEPRLIGKPKKRKILPDQSPLLDVEKKRRKADRISRRTRSRNQYLVEGPVTIILDSLESESEDNSDSDAEGLLVVARPQILEDSQVKTEFGLKLENVGESSFDSESELSAPLSSYQIKPEARTDANAHQQNESDDNTENEAQDVIQKDSDASIENGSEQLLEINSDTSVENDPEQMLDNDSEVIVQKEPENILEIDSDSSKENEWEGIVEYISGNTLETGPRAINESDSSIENDPQDMLDNGSDPITESESGPVAENKPETMIEKDSDPIIQNESDDVIEIDSDSIVENESETTLESEPQPILERDPDSIPEHESNSMIKVEPVAELEGFSTSESDENESETGIENTITLQNELISDTKSKSDRKVESDSVFSNYENVDDTEIAEVARENDADIAFPALSENQSGDKAESESGSDHQDVNVINIDDNDCDDGDDADLAPVKFRAEVSENNQSREIEQPGPDSLALVLNDPFERASDTVVDPKENTPGHEELPFSCSVPECPHRVKTNALLRKHMEGHLKQKRLSCHYCDWSANRLDFLDLHMKFHVQYRGIRNQFRERLHLNNAPLGKKGTDPTLIFACEQCNLAFKRSDHLKSHMTTHSNVKSLSCDKCGEAFKRVLDLTIHLSTCEKWVRNCAECGKNFKNERRLKRHLRKDHVPQCKKCGIKLNTRRGLLLHMHYRHLKQKENPNGIEKMLTNGNGVDSDEEITGSEVHKNSDDVDDDDEGEGEDNEADISIRQSMKNRFIP